MFRIICVIVVSNRTKFKLLGIVVVLLVVPAAVEVVLVMVQQVKDVWLFQLLFVWEKKQLKT